MLILFLALLLDWFLGDPDIIWRRLPHPVTLFGKIVDLFDVSRREELFTGWFSDESQRDLLLGIALVVVLLFISFFVSILVNFVGSFFGYFWWIIELIVVFVFLASRSLYDHVNRVFLSPDLESSRASVSDLVGRDVSDFNESEVSVATIESLGENFSDGVFAPIFWYLVLGLPGLLFYKAINTADSMIGHKDSSNINFGRPSALTDDILNWPASRLCSFFVGLVALITGRGGLGIFSTIMRDASTHLSPNSGWPESAFAASLDVCLGGTRRYGDAVVSSPYLNATGRRDLRRSDIGIALLFYRDCCYGLLGLVGLLGLLSL